MIFFVIPSALGFSDVCTNSWLLFHLQVDKGVVDTWYILVVLLVQITNNTVDTSLHSMIVSFLRTRVLYSYNLARASPTVRRRRLNTHKISLSFREGVLSPIFEYLKTV
jgi:hypothetical protein